MPKLFSLSAISNLFKPKPEDNAPVREMIVDAKPKKQSIIKVLSVRIFEKYKKVAQGRNYDLIEPDDRFITLANAIKVESYLRRARDRYSELIWKNGFDFVGKNDTAVKYVKQRFQEIAYVTQKPTAQLFEEMTNQMVLFYNCFVGKVRNKNSSSGNDRQYFNKTVQPVAGYFVLDCTKVKIRLNQDKKLIEGYEYEDENLGKETEVEFPFTDMIHMVIDKEVDGFFGEPAAIPVLDDIRALRRMEENVEILVFQHTIPLYQYTVGTSEAPCQEGEIDVVKMEVEGMVAQGMLITPDRHKIEAIGAQREALNVENYLNYFKTRIFTGLGHSAVSLGEGGSSNRATASTLSQAVIDAAIMFQSKVKTYVNEFMVNELLMEGGFDVFDENNKVELYIPEIDLDSKIRKEYHALQLYQGGLLDENEARIEIGRKPFTDDQRPFTYFEIVTLPTIEAQAAAKAAVAGAAAGTPASRQAKEGASRTVPRNQHGTKKVGPSQRMKGRDMIDSEDVTLTDMEEMTSEYLRRFTQQYRYALDDILASMKEASFNSGKMALNLSQGLVIEKGSKYVISAYKSGIDKVGFSDLIPVEADLKFLHTLHSEAIARFFGDIIKRVDNGNKTEQEIINVFESQEYRIGFIVDWFVKKAYWSGIASAQKAKGKTHLKMNLNGCDKCKANPDQISMDDVTIDMIPPYHSGCGCQIEL